MFFPIRKRIICFELDTALSGRTGTPQTVSRIMQATSTSLHPQEHLRRQYSQLAPELRRAADWVLAHPAEVGLWSMRRQAQALDVAPATMLRLARAIGYPSYNSFRLPFQTALHSTLRDKVQTLQSTHRRKGASQLDQLGRLQLDSVASITSLNDIAAFDRAATLMLQARQVGILGTRACYGIAFHLHYAYHFLKHNGILLDGAGGTLSEQVHMLQQGDALAAIGLAPYSRQTVMAVQHAASRGATVIALTDSHDSPLAQHASQALLFQPDHAPSNGTSASQGSTFFHSLTGAMALIEHLLARVAALGGPTVLDRAEEIDTRLRDIQAYWQPTSAPTHARQPSDRTLRS